MTLLCSWDSSDLQFTRLAFRGRGSEMTKTVELLQLRELARHDLAAMADFERALLRAPLFVHSVDCLAPGFYRMAVKGKCHRSCAVGVFTSFDSATWACPQTMRVESMAGAELLRSFPGATWHIDPGAGGLLLYPRDVARLLEIALPALAIQTDFSRLEVVRSPAADVVLAPKLHETAVLEAGASDLYLAAARPAGSEQAPDRILVLVEVAPESLDRCAQAISARVEALRVKPRLPLAIGLLDSAAKRSLDLKYALHPECTFEGRYAPVWR